jgi:hypothetical protein
MIVARESGSVRTPAHVIEWFDSDSAKACLPMQGNEGVCVSGMKSEFGTGKRVSSGAGRVGCGNDAHTIRPQDPADFREFMHRIRPEIDDIHGYRAIDARVGTGKRAGGSEAKCGPSSVD